MTSNPLVRLAGLTTNPGAWVVFVESKLRKIGVACLSVHGWLIERLSAKDTARGVAIKNHLPALPWRKLTLGKERDIMKKIKIEKYLEIAGAAVLVGLLIYAYASAWTQLFNEVT
jgi:hypothetical protein